MAFDPAVGTEGRVRVGAGNTVVAGIKTWRINKTCTPVPINHFELTANGDGVVFSVFERGLASATCTLNGFYNVDATDSTEGAAIGLRIGVTVSLDLLFTRTPFGYTDLAGFLTSFDTGTTIENQAADFNCTVQLTGVVAAAA